MKSQGITKVVRIHPPGTMNVQNIMTVRPIVAKACHDIRTTNDGTRGNIRGSLESEIHPVVAEIFQSGSNWLTDRPTDQLTLHGKKKKKI